MVEIGSRLPISTRANTLNDLRCLKDLAGAGQIELGSTDMNELETIEGCRAALAMTSGFMGRAVAKHWRVVRKRDSQLEQVSSIRLRFKMERVHALANQSSPGVPEGQSSKSKLKAPRGVNSAKPACPRGIWRLDEQRPAQDALLQQRHANACVTADPRMSRK